jgi:hypothetical protein
MRLIGLAVSLLAPAVERNRYTALVEVGEGRVYV